MMDIKKDDIVVVIPVYKSELSSYERMSLSRAVEILSAYKLVLIMPDSLKGDGKFSGFNIELFSDDYFRDIQGYNRLMLSLEFYERFLEYQYMLIYQLDAYVFDDKLLEFANLGYDYIGAPVPEFAWINVANKVGNGGLSLRRIQAFIELLQDYGFFRKDFEYMNGLPEDQFFAYCGSRRDVSFSVPTKDVAISFSLDMDVENAFDKLGEYLPFGCHGWSRPESIWRWKPYIPELADYQFDEDEGKELLVQRYDILKKMYQFDEKLIDGSLRDAIVNVLGGERCILWGYGKVGRNVEAYFEKTGITITAIIDSNEDIKKKYPNKNIYSPYERLSRDNDSKKMIVVSPLRANDEIIKVLEEAGMKENRNYILWMDLVNLIVKGDERL